MTTPSDRMRDVLRGYSPQPFEALGVLGQGEDGTAADADPEDRA
jgi:hypothetical protein